MNLNKVGGVFKDWVRSGYWFGKHFSNSIADRLEASPRSARFGGGIFDLAAGGGLVYMAGTSALATVTSMGLAVAAITTAPVSAVVAVAVGTIWMALSCMTGGIGIGLLHSAQEKSGIGLPDGAVVGQIRESAISATSSVKEKFKSLGSSFKKASKPKKPVVAPATLNPISGKKIKL